MDLIPLPPMVPMQRARLIEPGTGTHSLSRRTLLGNARGEPEASSAPLHRTQSCCPLQLPTPPVTFRQHPLQLLPAGRGCCLSHCPVRGPPRTHRCHRAHTCCPEAAPQPGQAGRASSFFLKLKQKYGCYFIWIKNRKSESKPAPASEHTLRPAGLGALQPRIAPPLQPCRPAASPDGRGNRSPACTGQKQDPKPPSQCSIKGFKELGPGGAAASLTFRRDEAQELGARI